MRLPTLLLRLPLAWRFIRAEGEDTLATAPRTMIDLTIGFGIAGIVIAVAIYILSFVQKSGGINISPIVGNITQVFATFGGMAALAVLIILIMPIAAKYIRR